MSDLSSIRKLFAEYPTFKDMDSGRKAAFRARLSRYLNEVEDEQVKGALLRLQQVVGKSELKSKDKLTVEQVEREFTEEFSGYDVKRRGAFKAKVARLLGEAEKAGDTETARRLAEIKLKWLMAEQASDKQAILDWVSSLAEAEAETVEEQSETETKAEAKAKAK